MKSALLRMQAARNGSSKKIQNLNPAGNDPKMHDFTFRYEFLDEILSPISRHEKEITTLSRSCDGIVIDGVVKLCNGYPSPAAKFRRRIRKTVEITPAKNRRCAAINSIFLCNSGTIF